MKTKMEQPEHKRWLCTYQFDGSEWSIEVSATSREEAEARLVRIGMGRVDGQLMGIYPGWVPMWVCDGWCRLMNFLTAIKGSGR